MKSQDHKSATNDGKAKAQPRIETSPQFQHPILCLQQMVGNKAVTNIIQQHVPTRLKTVQQVIQQNANVSTVQRGDKLSTTKKGLKTIQEPEIENVTSFLQKALSMWLKNPKFVQWLQNRMQLAGTLGSIKGSTAEIYKNIGKRKGVASTAKRGASALSAIAAIPTFFEMATAAQQMGAGEFEEAQEIFAKAAMVPGIDKLLNQAISWAIFDEDADWEKVAAGRDSLIPIVTAGLPETINLISAFIYGFSDTPVPEDSQFRMDPSVLDELHEYIPDQAAEIYHKLSRLFD